MIGMFSPILEAACLFISVTGQHGWEGIVAVILFVDFLEETSMKRMLDLMGLWSNTAWPLLKLHY